jgi:hypothetical protein
MKYKKLHTLPNPVFRRATGVKKQTFTLMVKTIQEFEKKQKKKKKGRPKKLSIENRLLMTLEYLREYRTYFHIAKSYDVAESVCYENTKQIENILIKSRKFSLPKRKELLLSENEIEVVLVDATETPIERPKKSKKKP